MLNANAIRALFLTALLSTGLGWESARAQNSSTIATALVFDATSKELRGERGQANFTFNFSFTNSAPTPVVIESVRTSCGCTVAQVPTLPWSIPAGGTGEFSVVLDARGKRGTVTKGVYVNSSIGVSALTVQAVIEEATRGMGADDRDRNLQIAMADRSAVFRGDCASCHAKPAEGKRGPALYLAACGVCHDSEHRASMVPDLKNLPHPTDREHWIRWISFGRHGSLMPAFSLAEGGPLSEAQIDSLVDYLTRTLSRRPVAQVPTPGGEDGSSAPAPVPIPATTGKQAATSRSAGFAKPGPPPPSSPVAPSGPPVPAGS